MTGDADNARIWLLGDVFTGDVGTDPPTDLDPETPLPAGWDALGLLSEDGLTEQRDEEVNDYFAWGGTLVRTTRSKHKRSFMVTALEDNPIVFDLVNPGSEVETAGGLTTRTVRAPQPNPKAFLFLTTDGDSVSAIVVDKGEVTEVGEVVKGENDMTMRELTIVVYPDADGVLYRELTTDPAAAVGS